MHKVKISTLYQNLIVLALSLFIFSRWSWGAFFPPVLFGGLLVLAAGMAVLLYAKNHKKNHFDIVCLLMLLMVLIMVFHSNCELKAAFNEQFFGGYFPIICIIPVFIAFQNKIEWPSFWMKSCIFFGTVYALITSLCILNNNLYYSFFLPILQRYYSSIYAYMHARPDSGFVADYGTNAIYIAYAFLGLVSLYITLRYSKINKHRVVISFILIFLAVILLINGKRSTLLGVIVALLLCYIVLNKERGRLFRAIVLIASFVIAFVILSFFIPALDVFFQVTTRISYSSDVSNGRLVMWVNAWNEFLNHPLLGKGWRWFQYNSIFKLDVHNTWLQLLAECGIIGSIPFYAFFLTNIKRSVLALKYILNIEGNNHSLAIAIFSFVNQVYFLVMIFFSTSFYSANLLIMYILACAVSNYYYTRFKREKTIHSQKR